MKTEDQVRLLTAALVGSDQQRAAALVVLTAHHEAVVADARARTREAKLNAYTAEELGDPIARAQAARVRAEERLAREEAEAASVVPATK